MDFAPDFEVECRICGVVPTVIVIHHEQPHTHLCGPHFFTDPRMQDYHEWQTQEIDS
jgi:hypothetical protein